MTSRESNCSINNEYTSDHLYAEGYHIDIEDIKEALAVPHGGEKLTPTTGNDPKTCMQRLKFRTLKHNNTLREAHKQLRARANNQASFGAFKKSNLENDTTLTQLAKTHEQFKVTKF